jgi:hypothetical protein
MRTASALVRRPRARVRSNTLAPALGEFALAAAGLAAVQVVLMYSGVPVAPPWQVLLLPILGLIYLGAGLVAWWRRPSNRIGALPRAGGLAWIAAGFFNVSQGPLVAVGLMTATLGVAVVVHLLHAFPSGRLRGRWSTGIVLAGYGVCVLLQAPLYLFSAGPLEIADRADLASAGRWVQDDVGALVMIATAVILARRLAGLSRAQRRVVGVLYAYGILAVLWVPASAQLHLFSPFALFEVQVATIAGVAVAFLLAMLLGGFARTVELQELGAWLGADDSAQPTLQAALADALGDPSLVRAFWIEDNGSYVDADGQELQLPTSGGDRAAVEVDVRAERVGAIVYDATLIADPGLVRAAGRIIAWRSSASG